MMTTSLVLVLLGALLPHSAFGVRVELRQDSGGYCCCKQEKCSSGTPSDDGTSPGVYSPNANLCCKLKKLSCQNPLAFSGYNIEAPSADSCTPAVEQDRFRVAGGDERPSAPAAEELPPGSPGHTVHNFCNLGARSDTEAEGAADSSLLGGEKGQLVNSLVSELSKNSLDSAAKEIFSIYACVRWAPSRDFVDIAESEMRTGQLPDAADASAYSHYTNFNFVPLRCSNNINVYGDKPELGQTHFETFERELEALSKWYGAEKDGAMSHRLQQLNSAPESQALSTAFDIQKVREVVSKCGSKVSGPILVNTFDASAEELLSDCGAAQFWLEKLEDWHRALPFTSFISAPARKAVPKMDEQVLICFGKRVGSQLHRRAGGVHLMTDQAAVGCHGFWDFAKTSQMMDRIVKLWRPPTCQLAAMELDMKMMMMDIMAKMNAKLFDALPAMLVEEVGGGDWDGKSLEASKGLGVLRGVANSVISVFSSLKGQYTRLGELLGDAVVKWVVCPLKPITNATQMDQLDSALGTEDDLARHYAKAAYAKWTGAKGLLPGQECLPLTGGLLPRAKECSLGHMREDMPEAYKDEQFICPVRPLLPAEQQLDIFKEKRDLCLLRMNAEQMQARTWFYRGHSPHLKQYNLTENVPTAKYQAFKIIGRKHRPDTEFAIWRTFVDIGKGCTEEEAVATPRWCEKPEVANPPASMVTNLLTGAVSVGSGVAAGIGAGTGLSEQLISNEARQQRVAEFLYGKVKGMEKWLKSSVGGMVGKARARHDKLFKRSFDEVEQAELLHSASFQKTLLDTGADSQGKQKFDRYAVVVPCTGFDPEYEFSLKFKWSESAINLARKADQEFDVRNKNGGFIVQLRGAGVLLMKNEHNAWMTYMAHVRATGFGGIDPSAWYKTGNPIMTALSGIQDAKTFGSWSETLSGINGFQAQFVCGTRVEVYSFPKEATSSDHAARPPFSACVKEGAKKNAELFAANPTEPFIREETVVRVTFSALPDCFIDQDRSLAQNVNETRNSVFATLLTMKGCNRISDAGELPDDLKSVRQGGNYRGLVLGGGLPKETLVEVLLDPADVANELGL